MPTSADWHYVDRGHPDRHPVAKQCQVGDLYFGGAYGLVAGEEYLDVWVVWGRMLRRQDSGDLRHTCARQWPGLIVHVLVGAVSVQHGVRFFVQAEINCVRLVVVKILADARQVVHHGNFHVAQVFLRSDS